MKKLLVVAAMIMIIFAGCKAQEITGGNIHLQHGEFDKAIAQFKLATEKYPNQAGPYVSLSAGYYERKHYVEAAEALSKALQVDEKEAKEKIKWYSNFLHLKDYGWHVFYNGAVKAMDEKPEKALEFITKAEGTEIPKYKSFSYNLHGNILNVMDKNDEALTYYEKSIEADENNIEPYLSLGRSYMIQNNNEKAAHYFEKALSIDSTVTDIYIWLGQAYLNAEEYGKAITMLEKASTILKDNPNIFYNLALSHLKKENYEKAIEIAEKALQLEEIDPVVLSKTYNLIGLAYITMEKYNEAINILEEAIEENPNNCEAYQRLSVAYYKLNNKKLSSKYGSKYDECIEQE